jgi:hypothetical protein
LGCFSVHVCVFSSLAQLTGDSFLLMVIEIRLSVLKY